MALASFLLLAIPLVFAAPPQLLRSFSAVLERDTWATETSYEERTVGLVSADESSLRFVLPVHTPDARQASTVQYFGAGRGLYQLEPFFYEHICYVFDLEAPKKQMDASTEWLLEMRSQTLGLQDDQLQNATPGDTWSVDGQSCRLYTTKVTKGPMVTTITACIGEIGELLASNSSTDLGGESFGVSRLFRSFSDTAKIPTPMGCVDLRGGDGSSQDMLVNDAWRLESIEAAAGGRWHAGHSAVFDGVRVGEARQRMGTTSLRALRLPLDATLGRGASNVTKASLTVPQRFDSRDRWSSCRSMSSIREQGSCGSCWAIAAVDVLADRACIASGVNVTLSVQYLLSCDTGDAGCDGGFVDNAWLFLEDVGVPSEECCPYHHDGTLEAVVGNADSCPAGCADGSPASVTRVSSAYAVSRPGDADAMMWELAKNGPIHAAFFVFSDFISYKGGTYFRTPAADLQGAHSVRILGWGVDKEGVEYWLVANSWGVDWGMDGFFHIQRGSNECGIETTPAAGRLASRWVV